MNLLGPSNSGAPQPLRSKVPEQYTDTMKRALNLTVEQNILPNWRQPRTLQSRKISRLVFNELPIAFNRL